MTEKQINVFETEKRRKDLRSKIKDDIHELVRKEEIYAKERERMRIKEGQEPSDEEESDGNENNEFTELESPQPNAITLEEVVD